MANTTNFGWETPDDTDLVKDGAAAIRTLGSAIDTSMLDLKGGTTGQVLSKTSNTDMDFTWVAQDDSNAIQNAIVDAKGDLIAATANDTPARLAVGANGTILVADSTAATGLKWATSGNFVGCRVYASAAQTISNATDTKLAYANESFDTDGFHSNVTNNTRITIPAGLGGYYKVTANSGFLSNASGRRIMAIALNGSIVSQIETSANASAEPAASLTDTYSLAAADYLEINVFQTSGGNLNTSGAAIREFFQVERIGS